MLVCKCPNRTMTIVHLQMAEAQAPLSTILTNVFSRHKYWDFGKLEDLW